MPLADDLILKNNELQNQNELLNNENEKLRKQIEELKKTNERLNKKLQDMTNKCNIVKAKNKDASKEIEKLIVEKSALFISNDKLKDELKVLNEKYIALGEESALMFIELKKLNEIENEEYNIFKL
ncbi:MAG: hypothetical protein LBO69_08425 [Ignavibacteria bacterium]|jgi:uncharacterized coiled-coil DUF342 family protein|nr:hypothetical protein [Ignavibacteria bacterium]